jgi:hypothetical protein
MQVKENTFNIDEKEKARRRLKYFENYAVLKPHQEREKQEILSTFPALKYVM